jgi:high affinity Mn2+ porin
MDKGLSRFFCGIVLMIVVVTGLPAQDQDSSTLFEHADGSRIWVSGQINVIHQQHPSFFSKYAGENSLRSLREKATSRVLTIYTGAQVTKSAEVLFDLESSGGRGISDALGLAGFTNLDVVRNPSLGAKPYMARLLFHQTIGLGGEVSRAERSFLSLMPQKPEKRIEIYAGKMSVVDFLDTNSSGSDSHLQFLNWTVDNNGAYDYAADTRGYTYGAVAAYCDRHWAVRFAEALMPKVANGIHLDWNLRRARAENLEVEFQSSGERRHTSIKVLGYLNHANMGSYREAIDAFVGGREPQPDIEAHRKQGRRKYGFGLNGEQDVTGSFRVYGRIGWNEGRHESFAYTEVNGSAAIGADLRGKRWHRPNDKVGTAMVINRISGDHRRYLQLGGNGFLLGDGTLRYGPEEIVESYYTARLLRGVFASVDFQHIKNPGYNRDRGPVFIPGLRLHIEF